MDYYIVFSLFVLGLIIGSFLNVVILRFDTGKSIAKGRSKCFSCNKELSWHELVPVLSYIFLLGKCRGCKTKISWQYPVVELSTGLLLPIIYIRTAGVFDNLFATSLFVLTTILFCLYIVICVYDIRHKIIPDAFSYTAGVIALAIVGISYCATGVLDPYQIIAAPVLFSFFWFFWFISQGRWMGFGDAKLALSVGFFLGLWQGIAGILFAFWIGAIISILVICVQKLFLGKNRLGFKSEIPFGPYIIVGLFIVWFWGIDVGTILYYLAV